MKKIVLTIAFYALILAACFSQGMEKRPIKDLVDANSTEWKSILELKSTARNAVEILPKENNKADAALLESQLSTNTFLGLSLIHISEPTRLLSISYAV